MRKKRPRKIDRWLAVVDELLDEYPRISAVRVLEELRKKGYDGGYTTVKEEVRRLRKKVVEPVVRFETAPGEQAQMDWSDCTIPFLTGSKKLKCFAYVLGFSRRMYIGFCTNEDFFSLIRRHVEAFKHLGGCAATCLYDNMKTVVLRWEADVPIYNPRFLLFATHYGFRPKACRPRRPRTKGKVERPFGYVKGNFLCGRRFHDIEDLNAQARVWLAQTADVRIHRTTRRRPIDLWEEERAALLPLPSRPYDTSRIAYKVASPEGFVTWEGNAYSVPEDFIGEIVVARASEKQLRLYSANFEEIGCHELAFYQDLFHRCTESQGKDETNGKDEPDPGEPGCLEDDHESLHEQVGILLW